MKRIKKIFWLWVGFFVLILLIVIMTTIFLLRTIDSPDIKLNRQKAELPISVVSEDIDESTKPQTQQTKFPYELNLDVPFTSQAPSANWDYTHEEACEEAAILMAEKYFTGEKFANIDDAEGGLREIIDFEKRTLGFFESTTAEETARVAKELYGLTVAVEKLENFEQIKLYIAQNKLVILPVAGREVGNQFYKSPGPLYHMILVKGYTENKLITNDAGTKRGENYPYNYDRLADATHDWNGGNVGNGERRIIIVSK